MAKHYTYGICSVLPFLNLTSHFCEFLLWLFYTLNFNLWLGISAYKWMWSSSTFLLWNPWRRQFLCWSICGGGGLKYNLHVLSIWCVCWLILSLLASVALTQNLYREYVFLCTFIITTFFCRIVPFPGEMPIVLLQSVLNAMHCSCY
jgi:hypothetical protein